MLPAHWDDTILITGFPAFTARRLISHLLEEAPKSQLLVLARGRFVAEAHAFLASIPGANERATVLEGDICDMDLGLSGDEIRRLTTTVTTIHHTAGIYHMGVDAPTARRVNLDGTRNVLALARETTNLRRFCHWSTATVSGKRKGVILEEELDEGQGFHNYYEETKFAAEKLARAAQRDFPVTIVRPGVIVGDSKTGEIDKFDGPYYLMVLFATNALAVHLPLPGRGTAPLYLVPIDFVVRAAAALAALPETAGKTFHLTDPAPFSGKRVYELVAEQSQTMPPKGFIPGGIARTLLRAPGIERLARAPLAFLDAFDDQVVYNARNTLAALGPLGIHCPALDTYVDKLVGFVQHIHRTKRAELQDEVFDPFD